MLPASPLPTEPVPDGDSVRLEEQQSFNAESLVLPFDPKKRARISGMAHEGTEEGHILYFTDANNPSKIKSLNLKTRQLAEVQNKYPIGLVGLTHMYSYFGFRPTQQKSVRLDFYFFVSKIYLYIRLECGLMYVKYLLVCCRRIRGLECRALRTVRCE